MVHSPFAAAFRPGARFRDEDRGSDIDMKTHVVGVLKLPSGRIDLGDPFVTSFEEPAVPLAQPAPTGAFPVELAVARFADNGDERVACARVRFVPNASTVRWTMALRQGQAPPPDGHVAGYGVDAGMGCFFDVAAGGDIDEKTTEAWLAATDEHSVNTWTWHIADRGAANIVMFSSGWGDGFYASWWGWDEAGTLVELVTDFEVLIGSTTERFELPLPLPRGAVRHPLLEKNDLAMKVPLLSRSTLVVTGEGAARIARSDGVAVPMTHKERERHYRLHDITPGARLIISVMTGTKPLDAI